MDFKINLEKAKTGDEYHYIYDNCSVNKAQVGGACKKAIGDNMCFTELSDFLKSTIEDEKQPVIGTGKEQGAAMGLDGKGGNKGNPGTGSGKPEVGKIEKPKVVKLSEDDEEDEKAVKPHKKPIEKALPSTKDNQIEYMQREYREYYDKYNSNDGEYIDFSKAVPSQEVDTLLIKLAEMTPDDRAADLVKSDQYTGYGNNTALGFNNQLVQQHLCSNCNSRFMKALTICPYCGKG